MMSVTLIETEFGALAIDRNTGRVKAVSRIDWQPLVGKEVRVDGVWIVDAETTERLDVQGRVVKVSDA